MRVVRVQVYASQRYRGKDGLYDRRSITLEGEIESCDGETLAILQLQKDADNALESWIDLHRFETPQEPAPVPWARPVATEGYSGPDPTTDDDMPF